MIPHAEINLRPYISSDAGAVVQLVNAAAAQSTRARCAVVDGVGNVRLRRYVPVESEKVVAIDRTNQVVGYAYLTDREQHIIYEVGGAVHPDCWGKGVGVKLLNWADERAMALSQRAPAGVKTVLQTNLYEEEHEAMQLFNWTGYVKARTWMHLENELKAAPPSPVIPCEMRLREIDLENDWELIGPAMDEAFADHWGAIILPLVDTSSEEQTPEIDDEPPEDETFSNSPGFCFVILNGDTAAGGILCNAKIVERSDTGRVGSVFVRPAHRRRGVGRALMLAAFGAFWRHGLRRIILDTDAESVTAAPRFYTSLGMHEYRREFLHEKEIRPGREIRRLK